MRNLTNEEMQAVSGGNDPLVLPTVTVVGRRLSWASQRALTGGGDDGALVLARSIVDGSLIENNATIDLGDDQTTNVVVAPIESPIWSMEGVVFEDIWTDALGTTGYTDVDSNRTWLDFNSDGTMDALSIGSQSGGSTLVIPN